MKRLMITADDFGASPEVNRAVEYYHREGLLTRAGLMVDGSSVDEALEIACRNPKLRVGLHWVLARTRPGWNGLRWLISPSLRREVEADAARQFSRFLAMGLAPTWWDGHFHLHMHPFAMRLAIPLAVAAGFRQTRLVGYDGGGGLAGVAFAALSALYRPRLRAAGIGWIPHVFGLGITGRATTAAVEHLMRKLPEAESEFYFHPGAEPGEWDCPRLRQVMAEENITLL